MPLIGFMLDVIQTRQETPKYATVDLSSFSNISDVSLVEN